MLAVRTRSVQEFAQHDFAAVFREQLFVAAWQIDDEFGGLPGQVDCERTACGEKSQEAHETHKILV